MSTSKKSDWSTLKLKDLSWHNRNDIPSEIHILDLERLESGQDLDKLKNILNSGHPFYIENAGISESDVESVFNVTRDFFNRSDSEKRKMVHPEIPLILRGYSAYGTGAYENSINNGKAINQYTKYAWGPSDNVYPHAEFKQLYEKMIKDLSDVTNRILDCIGIALELKSHDHWDNLFDGEDTVLHCQCYYPEKPLGDGRMITHADASSITLLNQLPAPNRHVGLQAKIGDDFVGIPPIRGTLVVMAGETLNSLSGGKAPPCLHAVTGPEADIGNSERSSMPFFANPKNNFAMKKPPVSTHEKFYNDDDLTTFSDYSNNIATAYEKSEEEVSAET